MTSNGGKQKFDDPDPHSKDGSGTTRPSPELAPEPSRISEHSPAPFIVPLIVFLVLSMFAPSFDTTKPEDASLTAEQLAEAAEYTASRNTDKARQYTLLLVIQVIVGFGLLAYYSKTYVQQFPLRISFWGILVGVVGCVLWVAICKMGIEHSAFKAVGLESWMPKRVGFDPNQIQSSSGFYFFLTFRFLLLAALVPIIEELFLRGWLIRYVDNEQWWKVTLASLSLKACAAATLYGIVTHPGEILGATVWFSLVTVMMKRTGNFWDCVVAHAITNLLLGVWVVYANDWFLW